MSETYWKTKKSKTRSFLCLSVPDFRIYLTLEDQTLNIIEMQDSRQCQLQNIMVVHGIEEDSCTSPNQYPLLVQILQGTHGVPGVIETIWATAFKASNVSYVAI